MSTRDLTNLPLSEYTTQELTSKSALLKDSIRDLNVELSDNLSHLSDIAIELDRRINSETHK